MFDRKAYNQAWYRVHKAERLPRVMQRIRDNKLKAIAYKGGKCLDCGFDDLTRPEVFQFDHLPELGKTCNVGNMLGYAWAKVTAELDKCELVCANCHATRTKARSN